MVWIFALGIVVLCVYNKGFRKVVLWGSPVWVALAILFGIVP
jgi:hypothetical protein